MLAAGCPPYHPGDAAHIIRSPLLTTIRRYGDGARELVSSLRGRRPHKPQPVPPVPPPGWKAAPPDFVGIGTARSGTSWWDELVHQHPDVARSEGVPKEVHFFDRFWESRFSDEDARDYAAFFARPNGKQAGEWTPGYMLDFWTPPLLRRAAPAARLLALLRDPVERFRSGLTLTENRMALGWTERASANGGFQRGLYADQLLRVFAAFPREQVLVLQYERCVREPREQLRRTFTFLGLDPAAADGMDVERRVNGTSNPKVELNPWQLSTLRDRYAAENRRVADLVPDLDLSLWESTS